MDAELLYHGLFYFLAAVGLGSACVVAFSRDLSRAIFMLLFALGAVAGFYAWLGAGYVAIIQLLAYVGGILVILLFALMVSEQFPVDPDASDPQKLVGSLTFSLVFVGSVVTAGVVVPWPEAATVTVPPINELGLELISTFLLPFLLAGVLLLAALMGATMLTRNPDETRQGESS